MLFQHVPTSDVRWPRIGSHFFYALVAFLVQNSCCWCWCWKALRLTVICIYWRIFGFPVEHRKSHTPFTHFSRGDALQSQVELASACGGTYSFIPDAGFARGPWMQIAELGWNFAWFPWGIMVYIYTQIYTCIYLCIHIYIYTYVAICVYIYIFPKQLTISVFSLIFLMYLLMSETHGSSGPWGWDHLRELHQQPAGHLLRGCQVKGAATAGFRWPVGGQ
jgi:hypothetical protein